MFAIVPNRAIGKDKNERPTPIIVLPKKEKALVAIDICLFAVVRADEKAFPKDFTVPVKPCNTAPARPIEVLSPLKDFAPDTPKAERRL